MLIYFIFLKISWIIFFLQILWRTSSFKKCVTRKYIIKFCSNKTWYATFDKYIIHANKAIIPAQGTTDGGARSP